MNLGTQVGLDSGHIVLDGYPAPPPQSPQFSAHVLWPNGWMDQDATRYGGIPRPRRNCVRWGTSTPKKGAHPPFSAHVYCGQTAVCTRIPLGTEVGLMLGNIMLDGDPVPPPRKGTAPKFSARVLYGQTAGWMKTPLSTEVDLGPVDIAIHGDPAPPAKKAQQPPPLCGPGLLWPRSPTSATAELLFVTVLIYNLLFLFHIFSLV